MNTNVKRDSLGTYIVADEWVVRPSEEALPSSLSMGQQVNVERKETHGRVGYSVDGEPWSIRLPALWHPVEGDTPQQEEERQRLLAHSPEAFANLYKEFSEGRVVN